jgi:glutamine synthetase
MVLIPDLSTLYQIPWSPDLAKIICNVYYPPKKEGAAMYPFEGCSRSILKGVTEKMEVIVKERLKKIFPKASISNIRAYFAPEVEFLLLPNGYDEERIHLDSNLKNNHYFVSFTKKIDEVMIKIIEYLGLMGLKKEKYHTEVSTFQYEVGIGHGRVLLIADGVMTMKYIIEKVAEAHDLKASFIPKFNRNVNGSGMHVHQNIVADIDGEKFNLFYDPKKRDGLSEIGANYIAGLLKNATKLQP